MAVDLDLALCIVIVIVIVISGRCNIYPIYWCFADASLSSPLLSDLPGVASLLNCVPSMCAHLKNFHGRAETSETGEQTGWPAMGACFFFSVAASTCTLQHISVPHT